MSDAEEFSGKLAFQNVEDKLMHSVLENDKKTIEEAKLMKDCMNQGISSFTPDLMFEQLVDNYSIAKQIFGESIIRQMTGYDERYVEKNIKIPEFQRELKKQIKRNIEQLKKEGLINKNEQITEKGIELASLIMYVEEIENLVPKGIVGKKISKKSSHYGRRDEVKTFSKDRYKDIAIRKTIKTAIRRGHKEITVDDLKAFTRQSRGEIHIIFGMDSSGSMKGTKIGTCKKAGIALAYRAILERDKVGLIVFGSEVKESIAPTKDFTQLLKAMTKARASMETDMVSTIERAVELFGSSKVTKHLILLTDALPTVGKEPEKKTLQAAAIAASGNITISIIGINLDEKGEELAKRIVEVGKGKLYTVKNLENLDKIVLQDYYSVR